MFKKYQRKEFFQKIGKNWEKIQKKLVEMGFEHRMLIVTERQWPLSSSTTPKFTCLSSYKRISFRASFEGCKKASVYSNKPA